MRALDRVRRLEPIQFRYAKDIDPGQELRAGFSAQQVQEIIPEAVKSISGVLMLDLDVLSKVIDEARKEEAQEKS